MIRAFRHCVFQARLRSFSKTPAQLKRQIEENVQHIEAQKRFIANQDGEKVRINARFDDELVKLKLLWTQSAAPATAAAPGGVPAKN